MRPRVNDSFDLLCHEQHSHLLHHKPQEIDLPTVQSSSSKPPLILNPSLSVSNLPHPATAPIRETPVRTAQTQSHSPSKRRKPSNPIQQSPRIPSNQLWPKLYARAELERIAQLGRLTPCVEALLECSPLRYSLDPSLNNQTRHLVHFTASFSTRRTFP